MITFLLSVTCLLMSTFLHFKKIQDKKYNKPLGFDIDFYSDILFFIGLMLFFAGIANIYALYLSNVGYIS